MQPWPWAVRFFDDPRRTPIRQRTKRPFVVDYLFKSEVSDYRRLRFLVNGVIGLLISSCLYYLAWKRLNFADFDHTLGRLTKWFIIVGISAVFTYNPLFRGATLCLVFGAIGKNGQLPLSMLVFNSLNDGPITSIVENFQLTADAVMCNLQVQSDMTTTRVAMLTGPLEELLEEQMLRGITMAKKISSSLKSFVDPFKTEFSTESSEEDRTMKENDKAAKILMERDRRLKEEQYEKEKEIEDEANARTKGGRKVTERMSMKCNEIFNKGLAKCNEVFADLKLKCLGVLRLPGFYLCNKIDVLHMCEDAEKKMEGINVCRENIGRMEGSDTFDEQVASMNNITEGIEDEMRMNIHLKAVSMPRVEESLAIDDIKLKLKGGISVVKLTIKSIKEIVSTLLIFFMYIIFRDAVKMINNYRTNVEFNNKFITKRFWEIDQERIAEGSEGLRVLSKMEWKKHQLQKVFGWPTKAELKTMKVTLIRWTFIFIISLIIVAVDRYFVYILDKILPLTVQEIVNNAVHKTTLRVLGKGALSELINSILSMNTTRTSEQEFSTEQCQFSPIRTDPIFLVAWLFLPLIFMLVLQVIFGFVIKRVVLFYVLPFMFPRRGRIRIIYLYNKILFARYKSRQQARQRIRFLADRWKLNDERNDGGIYSKNSWFKRHFLDVVFKSAECLYCKTRCRRRALTACPDCPAVYCVVCLEELHGDCYACLAQEGAVTSAKSQLESISNSVSEKLQASKREQAEANKPVPAVA